jgi:hypothetical protein
MYASSQLVNEEARELNEIRRPIAVAARLPAGNVEGRLP